MNVEAFNHERTIGVSFILKLYGCVAFWWVTLEENITASGDFDYSVPSTDSNDD
jgi:hypothetical protein